MSADRPISVVAALERAASWTKVILFDRFTMSKWFILGFCAFLADLGQGGGGGFNPSGFNRLRDMGDLHRAGEWVVAHLPLLLLIGGGIFILAFALGVLILWLSCRGTFMFLEGVTKDRAAVEEPWFRFKRLGNSLFFFRLILGLAVFAVFVLVGVVCWGIARPSLSGWRFDGSPMAALVLGLLIILPISLASIVVNLFLKDFVTPIMFRRDLATVEAFKVFFAEVLTGRAGELVLFYLLKLVLFIAAAIVMTVGTCITCCIAGLPYISSVVFLPIHVFFRCFSLYFLEQAGDEWRFFEESPPAPPAPPSQPAPYPPADTVPMEPAHEAPEGGGPPPDALPPHAEDV